MLLDNLLYGLRLIRMLNYDPGTKLGPVRVDIAPTSACNYHCYFCKAHSSLLEQHVSPQHMDGTMLAQLLDDLKRLRVKNLLFAGNGEPLLNSSLPDIIRRRGKDFDIEILSNGSTLDIVDESLFNGLETLTISLNSGNGKAHPDIHGYSGKKSVPGDMP